MLKLFWSRGSCALASHIMLEEVGADYTHERIDLKAGDQKKSGFLAVNPKGAVPALVTDRGVLTENPVILGYLAQTYPDAKMAPNDDSFAFGDMQAFNMYLATTVHQRGFRPFFRPYSYADGEACQAEIKRKVPKLLADSWAYAEEKLADGRPWIHGEAYTTSDPYCFVLARWLDIEGTGGIDRFPHLKAHRDRVGQREAVKRAVAIQEG